MAAQSLMDEPE